MKDSQKEGKIDGGSKKARGSSAQQGADQSRVSALWQSMLGLPRVGLDDNFFEIGGTSLLATVLLTQINREFGRELGIAAIFDCPTPRAMTRLLNGEKASFSPQEAASKNPSLGESPAAPATPLSSQPALPAGSIAIVGMTGRFPGAETIEDFWRNLASGVESITFFGDEELEIPASERGPCYVAARPVLKDTAMFDAAFFGIYPKEAEQMDPQHRVFLECAWEVLERAGYDPAHTPGAVGVFAGCSMNTYFMQNLAAGRKYLEDFAGSYQVGSYVTMLGNDKDFLATRVSYKLNLRGPSITVQTACSTSLVAVNQACESLLAGGCDMALAGAVSITFPQRRGYLPQEGGLASLDGHCRPFDRRANGTVFGHGAAVLLLKRLDRAVADGDQILAVIRGAAVNNDGSGKVGYTAPSVEGQAEVVSRARKMAGVPAESITYLEAHGTGTPLGDPIEIAALNRSFRSSTAASRFCSIGTAKANVGHLDVASGATGLIKTVLQMQHRFIPKLLHFEQPNPHLELDGSPFVFDCEPREWKRDGFPLRAGVSAFGVGGTNAHVIVEEAPDLPAPSAGRKHQLFVWSAKSAAAADAIAGQLAGHFHANPELNFADAAYTLQASRSRHKYRRALQASNLAEAASALAGNDSDCWREDHPFEAGSVVFCFPGQGVQTIGMAYGLYRDEPVFREWMDRCDAILRPTLDESLLAVLYPEATRSGNRASAGEIAVLASRLNQTGYAQPAIFAVEYSLAQLWISWGIRPAAMVGHSIGEFAAATLAGVLSLEDALHLVAARGRIMQELPAGGAMLAVRAAEGTVVPLLGAKLDLAAVNGPLLTVVSGPEAEIAALVDRLDAMQIQSRRLITSHAFHSRLVEPALAAFAVQVSEVDFGALAIPYVSTLTGQWVTAEELSQPAYWTRQMREPVRFGRAIEELLRTPQRILLEVGPGETAAQIMRQTALAAAPPPAAPVIVSSLAGKRDGTGDDTQSMLSALARLWLAGAEPDWTALHGGEARRRVLLPTYPFERKRYWAELPAPAIPDAAAAPFQMSANPTPVNNNRIAENAPASASSSAEGPFMSQNANATHSNGMLEELKALVTDLSGADLSQVDGQAYFLELGFDSLFLTQLTQAIQGKYRVKLTFREIMESYPTLGGLADHLEATVAPALRAPQPAAATAQVSAAAPASVVPAVATASSPAALPANLPAGSYEALFASQMQMLSGLFAQQLELLRAQQTAGVSAPLPAATVAAAPQAPSQIPAPVPAPAQATTPQKTERTPDNVAQNAKPAFTPFKPLQRGTSGGLNPRQQRYLDSFIRDYNRRTPSSKEFTQKHRKVFADGRVVSGFHAQVKEIIYPLVVDRASGAYLWDKDGNRYIDILNGFGAILYGHSPEFIVEAVRRQLEIGFPIGPQTELAGECAELVRDLTGMERVTFCNTGSEAVMGAMRLARTVTGRNLIALFTGDYHGSFDEVLVKAVGQRRSMPAAPGIPRESVANILVLDYGSPESLEILRQRAGELAGVLVEPVQSRHPELRPVEFLREVRQLTEQNGAALIFDEVVTGFRTHPGGMQALYGIRADLATYGKVVAGGLPVGVLSGSAAYMDALDGGQWQFGDDSFPQAGVTFYAGTFMRHPLAMAAVKASLEHLKASGPGLQKDLAEKTSALVTDLKSMCREFSYPATLETFSSWFFLAAPTEPRLARMLHFHLREKGIHIQEGFPCFLTTAHTAADLDAVRDAFREGLRAMTEGQALTTTETIAPAGTPLPEPSVARTATAPLSTAAAASAPQAGPVARDFAITEPQREILFGTQLGDEANCAFNESTSLTLTGNLDSSALIASLEDLIVRHEALRSTVAEDGETVHVAVQTTLALEQDDLSSLSSAEREKTLETLLAREASTPFDLHRGPLFRFRLVCLERTKHVLILTAHHILFDGWSTNVLYRELSELYNARTKGVRTEMGTPLALHEYAAAQNRRHGSVELATVESFWIDQFKTLPAPLQLPTDRPRQALRTNSGATKRYVFPGELAKSLRMAGARQGSTLFATLLASYSLLIHRLCQQNDVVIGVPMAGQSQIENGSTLIGHCVNFLPIRSRYSPDEPLSQFLKQTRKTLLDAQDHQDYTYGTLLRALKVPRDPSRLQLVEVQFNLEQVGAGLNFDSLGVDLRANPKTSVNMDLFFNFVDRGTELWLDCDYNTDLFDASTIDRWFEHMESILRAFADNIGQPAANVSLLSAKQMDEMLTAWNRTEVSYPNDPRHGGIHHVFEQQARLTPHAPAVIAEQSLTYAELNSKANQLARYLEKSGVKPGGRVAVCLERSLESIVSLLGILKAGAAYVPVDPSYPASRLAYLVADSQTPVLLTQSSIAANLPSLPVHIICLDIDWPAVALEASDNSTSELGSDSLAYVMYTSGSTGNPKGVLVPHRAVLRLVKNNSFASFSSDEVFLQLAPLSFDAATFEIWGALLNGGRLVLAPAGRLAPEEIGRLITSRGITTMWLTAALFHLMAADHLDSFRPLRQLLAGGDVLSLAHVRRVVEEFPSLRLINGYGPTENTTFTCCHTIVRESLKFGTVPIGKPIANTRIYLLDSAMKPVPPGVTGELYAAGDGLALGYLNAPELTTEKFLHHMFENGRRERLYRTGDLARYRPDGTVEFLGRADTQVKIRGYRVELAEIEHALERSPLVRSAVVAVRSDWSTAQDSPGDKRLAAYVVPQDARDHAALIQELRRHLSEELPQYMQPAAIMVLDSLPRTLNGKVDRQALPAPQPEKLLREREVVYPRTAKEETLAGIWAKVLGVKEAGVNESIFELGGDSLLIFRITTLANQAGLGITARHIFQYRTIAAICEHLEDASQEKAGKPVAGIQAVSRARYRRPQTTLQ